MSLFCLTKTQVAQLKESAIKKEVDIKKLYVMSSAERNAFFTKLTNKDLGTLINTKFEQAMISKQKTALTDWAKSVFTPKAQAAPVFKSVLDKINQLDEMGVLTPKSQDAFLHDLVSDKLGVSVSPEEVAQIKARAEKIQSAQEVLGNNLGDPAFEKETTAFFLAKKEMDDYLQSLAPASNLKVLTGTIGRGMMLASVKSPILNIGSNTIVGITEALSRRLASNIWRGANAKLATDYVKMANRIYQKTGYDISRMMTLNDSGASGQRVLGDTVHTQGKGAVRATGRVVEDIVFKQLMGAPDVAYSSAHFADSVNLQALKLAKGDKVKATEMMRDAMKVVPQTEAGEILKEQGIMDAQYATYTNKSWASNVSEGIRKLFNDLNPDVRIGDYLMPFVKTPANVVSTGLDYSGLGAVKAIWKTGQAFKNGNFGSKEYTQSIVRDLVRAGIGFTGAVIIASNLKKDDFVGAYDPARASIEALRSSNTNSIRIGGKWISLDWFGPLSVPIASIMYARQYGNTPAQSAFQYVKGGTSQIVNIPGIREVYDLYKNVSASARTQTLDTAVGSTANTAISGISSRLIPSILSDVAKAISSKVRDTGGSATSGVVAKIPGLNLTLPVKRNIFGEEIRGEGAISSILFGARVKTSTEDALVSEINRVATANDKGVSFTDWKKSSSKTLAQFKQVEGNDAYKQATIEYGQELKKQLTKIVSDSRYQNAAEADKLKLINGADTTAQTAIFRKYGFVYRAPVSHPIKIR